MELKRTMHHGRMLIALSAIQQPREIGVQAFIMAHHPVAQAPEAAQNGQDDEGGIEDFFPIQSIKHGQGLRPRFRHYLVRYRCQFTHNCHCVGVGSGSLVGVIVAVSPVSVTSFVEVAVAVAVAVARRVGVAEGVGEASTVAVASGVAVTSGVGVGVGAKVSDA